MTEPDSVRHADWYGADTADRDPVAQSELITREARSAAEVLGTAGPREARRQAEGVAWRIVAFGALVTLIISIGMGVAAIQIARTASTTAADERVARLAADEDRKTTQATTNQAIEQLKSSNEQLAARGQAPVATPGPSSSASDALVAATTARVLAAIPAAPTTAQIGQMIALAVAATPPAGPTATQLSGAVAAYFATNPPPVGERGEQGERGQQGEQGPGPTADQIQAAVDTYLAANPPAAGPPGPSGEPGPACPPGTHLEAVQFGLTGPTGQGCVNDQ
jgi:hypothetical protein